MANRESYLTSGQGARVLRVLGAEGAWVLKVLGVLKC
jgi:hypothetical protein